MGTLSLFEPEAPLANAAEGDLHARVLEVHACLCAEYECPIAYFHDLDPLAELVSSLLSHRTKNEHSGRAFKRLRAQFPEWVAVMNAPVEQIEAAIEGVTWPEQKAPRVQAVLREIQQRRGELSLDFLGEMPVREARNWLEGITGIGPKTSAAVLNFSTLRLPALAVDSHHHRVAWRLGFIPATVSVGPAHALLEAMLPANWDAQQVYDHHEVLMLHGQQVCFHHNPACHRCAVLNLCPFGQRRVAAGKV